jgi:hypothetical protein
MRLKVSKLSAEESLIQVINAGYARMNSIQADHDAKHAAQTYNPDEANGDIVHYNSIMNEWGEMVYRELSSIFPTELEWNAFLHPPTPGMRTVLGTDSAFGSHIYRWNDLLGQLRRIREVDLNGYTDLPMTLQIYVEDVDSFRNVRDVNPRQVHHLLDEQGVLQVSEDEVQQGIEQIIGEIFHKKDWGGEINDLYSSLVQLNGRRIATAFLLKGNGLRKHEMRIADCGKNGDQIQRLFHSAADLFVVQFVGRVGEDVIGDVSTNAQLLRNSGRPCNYLIIDALDTARLLFAYDKIPKR